MKENIPRLSEYQCPLFHIPWVCSPRNQYLQTNKQLSFDWDNLGIELMLNVLLCTILAYWYWQGQSGQVCTSTGAQDIIDSDIFGDQLLIMIAFHAVLCFESCFSRAIVKKMVQFLLIACESDVNTWCMKLKILCF